MAEVLVGKAPLCGGRRCWIAGHALPLSPVVLLAAPDRVDSLAVPPPFWRVAAGRTECALFAVAAEVLLATR